MNKELLPSRKILTRKKTILFIVIGIVISLVMEMLILDMVRRNSARHTASLMLAQVSGILLDNEENVNQIVEELKGEYISLARFLAYFLDKNPELEYRTGELTKIVELLGIDEIHLFDASGTIYAGTKPEYYGYNFNSGDQMSYFLPMLLDHSLAMCQDVTPNTAENKNMMYAIAWCESGDRMVQVGIEPVRLLDELKENSISEVVQNMPAYEGMNIYIADRNSGVIQGATRKEAIGLTMKEVGLSEEYLGIPVQTGAETVLMGEPCGLEMQPLGDYLVVVSYLPSVNTENMMVAIIIEIILLLVTSTVIYLVIHRLIKANEEKNDQLNILISMSDIYYSMHLIDLQRNTAKEYRARNEVGDIADHEDGADEMMVQVMNSVTTPECREETLKFCDIHTIAERMKGESIVSGEFVGKRIGWFEASFIRIEADADDKPTKVMFVTRSIDVVKKREQALIQSSTTDELTGLLNRRAYEADLAALETSELLQQLVYVSIDVNKLKIVNDTLGHAAGDELLIGASECMKRGFSSYGKLYRTGGDEFVALIYADDAHLERIRREIEEATASWRGKLVDSVSISCGFASMRRSGVKTLHELSLIADQRMYDAKAAYYQKEGVDRRGQKEAYTALCALYTKILKINITNDSYQILNMDESEQTGEMGFSDRISSWLSGFGMSGQVHPEDLEQYLEKTSPDYMRRYFKDNKTSLHIFYRRKYKDGYKQVLMEMIPASDYSDEDQNLFLYVKDIDK